MVLISVGRVKSYFQIRLISAGVALDAMDEDRKGFENFNAKWYLMVLKVIYAVMKIILCGISIPLQAIMAVLTDMAFRYGYVIAMCHYKSKDYYLRMVMIVENKLR
jgi:iron complex outermembrane receptor protein